MVLSDVEMREMLFDCAGSHKTRPASLSGSILRGIYRTFVMLHDVEMREMRLHCADSHKMRPASVAGSILRGICCKFVMLSDVEARFDAQAHTK